jgi:16S rRNA (guanine527-N7)-methyltransferase
MVDLVDGLKKCGIPENAAEPLAQKMEAYIKEIVLFNSAYNLTNTSDRDELVVRHIFDSLAAWKKISEMAGSTTGITIADIGSGGGLPGIPLAAAFATAGITDVRFELVERMEKRCAFLQQVVRSLKLNNAKVLCLQADKVKPESFTIEVFRAFHPFDTKITKLLLKMLCKGGFIAAYKARSEKIALEMEAVSFMVPSYKKIALTVPFLEDHERNLVVIQK